MRFALLTATLFVSSQAFACGMYIPAEMKVASIGTVMDLIDEPVEDDGFAADVVAADVEVVPVEAVGFEGIEIEPADADADEGKKKKDRKARKNAPNS
ncbi:MAG: hypothetical protein H6737_03490 [Alphaproteobacteria bacterium]|nr:hypothetical protein [Alphaproteobacteria bacterium]